MLYTVGMQYSYMPTIKQEASTKTQFQCEAFRAAPVLNITCYSEPHTETHGFEKKNSIETCLDVDSRQEGAKV